MNSRTTVRIEDADYEFKDDATDQVALEAWTTDDPDHVQTYAPGSILLEDEYEITVRDNDGTEYRMVAISNASNEIVGYTFEGDWPESGTVLTIVSGTNQDLASMIMCFTRGVELATSDGNVAVEDLKEGDLVQTLDHGLQPVLWIGKRKVGRSELRASPNLVPVRIQRGALGNGCPRKDLVVSPQHRVLVSSRISRRMFGRADVLVAAKHLTELEGIDLATDLDEVEYHHVLFARHEIVLSNGAPTESLYSGPEALKSLDAAARREVFALFPELRERDFTPPPARTLVPGRQARSMARRHKKNAKPLVVEGEAKKAA